jgi:anti-sigma-K factor RskA
MEAGIHELTAGYALDALDADERTAYEAHLAGCEQCRLELGSFWETTEALAVAASGPAPSPALRERILSDVRAEPPQNVVPFEPRRRRVAPVLGAVAAVAAVAALALGIWGASLSSDLDESRAALERQQEAAQILVHPGAQSVALQAGDGRLVVDPDGQAVLVVNASPVGPSETYEMWIVPQGDINAAEPAGTFSGIEGRLETQLVDGTVEDGDVVAVTIEKSGGVDKPTTQPIVVSDPV